MSAGRSSIAVSLGSLQHLRKQPAAETRIPATPEYPDTRIPEVPRLASRETGKRSHPDYGQVKAYVLKATKKAAMKQAEEDGYEDFSALVQLLLEKYLAH